MTVPGLPTPSTPSALVAPALPVDRPCQCLPSALAVRSDQLALAFRSDRSVPARLPVPAFRPRRLAPLPRLVLLALPVPLLRSLRERQLVQRVPASLVDRRDLAVPRCPPHTFPLS